MTPGRAETPNRSRWMRAPTPRAWWSNPSWGCTTPPTWATTPPAAAGVLWRHGRIRGGSSRSLQWVQPAEW